MTINVDEISTNLRPSALGSADVTTDYGTPYVFTVDDFIIDTLGGVYTDPEGDAPYKLKFLEPWSTDGSTLKYNGVNTFTNMEIPISDIAAGLLIFTPSPSTPIIGTSYEGSAYTISDVGSQLYFNGAVKLYVEVNAQE